MNLAKQQVASENVIHIETDKVLDLGAFETFLVASKQANMSATRSIDVDLGKTVHIRDSGLAMLQMLRKQTKWGTPIRLVNWDPVIHRRLAAIPIGTDFQLV
jgi:hypothetical protein